MNQSSYSYYGYYYEQDGAVGNRVSNNKKKSGFFRQLIGAR